MAWEGDSWHVERAYSVAQKRMLTGMNEDSYVGKIQGKRRVFFFFKEMKFSRKGKKKRVADASRDIFSSLDWGE